MIRNDTTKKRQEKYVRWMLGLNRKVLGYIYNQREELKNKKAVSLKIKLENRKGGMKYCKCTGK